MGSFWLWTGFIGGVLVMLAIDLLVVGRRGGVVAAGSAVRWTITWVSLSLLFCVFLGWQYGPTVALPWLAGYVVEYSLSVDNLFVFLVVFAYFKVRSEHQHRLLYWGIIGALVLRGSLILVGAALVQRFHYILYVFGAFLLYTAWKLLRSGGDDEVDPEKNPVLRWGRKLLPMSQGETGHAFFVRQGGLRVTPLFLVLLVIETTDLLFAIDSIPAVLGVSQDAFVVFSSNVCAILGLRSLFFVVAALMDKFRYLKTGVAIVLGFVGVKMVVETAFDLSEKYQLPLIVGSLAFIVVTLAIAVVASALKPASRPGGPAAPPR